MPKSLYLIIRLGVIIVLLPSCSNTSEEQVLQGYVEGEFLHLAAPLAGTLKNLPMQRGVIVNNGELLFALDAQPDTIAVHEAEQRLIAARARLADLKKGQRPTEISAVEARRNQAQTDLELAKTEQERYEALFEKQLVQKETVDSARAATQRNKARLDEIIAQLHTARLGARQDTITAAEAEVEAAQANLEKARWWLEQKHVNAPSNGQVIDIYYYEGEWVPAGNPVISFLPPERVKIRFFIPEKQLSTMKMGQAIVLSCDGCTSGMTAHISYIAEQAEYTPPVIYSRETRAKLVYRVEAKPSPENATRLHPGQPVDIRLP